MFKTKSYDEIEKNNLNEDYIFIDLRSESEYRDETIPGAINIPILDDDERKIVGTAYKQEDAEKAKMLGLEFVGKKLPQMYKKISHLNTKDTRLVFFCSRGGYRSSSLVALLSSIGIHSIKLEDGYKGYRHHIIERLPSLVEDLKFIVLYGNTGTGKTEILKYLDEETADVLDLEGAANHRGSTLGGVGLGEQNSQKMFESILYQKLKDRKTNTVFTEGESKRIGRDVIPECIFDKMKSGVHLNITSPIDYRVETILKDYVQGTDDELIEAIKCLERHLGKSKVERYISLIKSDNYEEVIEELMINYYDPLYEKNTRNFVKSFHSEDHCQTAKDILAWFNNENENKTTKSNA